MNVLKFVERDEIVRRFAEEMARLQAKCDKYYYIDKDMELCNYIQAKIDFLKDFSIKLEICAEMYEKAYQIYDFRNSGKSDYVPSEEQLEKMRKIAGE